MGDLVDTSSPSNKRSPDVERAAEPDAEPMSSAPSSAHLGDILAGQFNQSFDELADEAEEPDEDGPALDDDFTDATIMKALQKNFRRYRPRLEPSHNPMSA